MSRGAIRRSAAAVGVAALAGTGVLVAATPGSAAAALPLGAAWGEVRLPGEVIRESSPLLVQLNGGALDIVVGTMSGNLVAVDGDSGAQLWKRGALSAGSSINSAPSAADVDGDGTPEIFVGSGIGDPANPAAAPGALLSFEADGTPRAGFPLRVPDGIVANPAPGIHASPAIGDVDQDGRPDVVFTSLANKSIWAVTADGQALPGFPYYTRDTNYSTPALADLDGDGVTDFVTGQDQSPAVGAPAAESQHCGSIRGMTGFATDVFAPVYRDEIVRSSPAVGDVDGDGAPEIVVGSGNYWSNPANQNASSHQLCPNPDPGHVLVLSTSGALERDITVGGSAFPSPALADVNGDGVVDVVIGTSTQTGSGGGYVVAFDVRNGQTIWKRTGADGPEDIIGGVSAADLNGDGRQDVLVSTGSGLYVHDGATGDVIARVNLGQVSYQNTPAVADVDGNGLLDVVVAGSRGGDGAIQRFQVGVAGSIGALSWPTFHHDARRTGNLVTPPLSLTPPAYCAAVPSQGYWLATADGGVNAFCHAQQLGSAAALHLNQPVVSMASTVTGRGYWLMAADGGVFSFGDAGFYGSTGAMRLNKPIITAMPTQSGAGYWLIASDGGVFSFGDAAFYGSTGAMTLNRPIVSGMATPSGRGYWLIASDGGVFAFGDAAFYGSTGSISLNKPIVASAATPSGLGYWMFASDGGVFTFGDAAFLGSLGRTGVASPVVAAATP